MRLTRILFCLLLISALLIMVLPAAPARAAVGTIGVYPITGPPGNILGVSGTGFTPGSTYNIHFGGASLSTGIVDASGNINVGSLTVPVLPRGPYSVTVTTSAGDTSNTGTFNIVPSIILDVSSGRVGDTVKVNGNGFAASVSISINLDGTGVTTITADASGVFYNAMMVIPPTSPGQHSITGYDGLAFSPSVTFTVYPRVTVTPNVQTAGSQVTISGSGFTLNSPIVFYINNVALATGAVISDINGAFANVSLTVPPLTQGSHTLKAQDGNLNTGTAALYIRPGLVISPQSGPPGTTVTVTGNGFATSAGITVTYSGATIATSTADTNGSFSVTFNVPSGASGAYSVTGSDGTNSASTSFTIAAGGSLSPLSGPAGTTVTVRGYNFNAGGTVTVGFDGNAVATTAADSSGTFSATFSAPYGRSGAHLVTAGDNVNSVSLTFTILPGASLSPLSGYVDGSITVNGNGYVASGQVNISFDRVVIATATTSSLGAFSTAVKVPASASGSHQVTAADLYNNTVTLSFTTMPSATISPAIGYVDTNITVKGTGFGASRPIGISYEKAQVTSYVSDATGGFSISFKAPGSPTGAHQVTASDGTGSAILAFTIVPGIGINPTSGYVGSNVVVQGSGFAAAKAIAVKYDNTQVVQSTTDASGVFSATFAVPASKGGNHLVSVTDGTSTLSADFAMDSTPPPAPVTLQPADGTKADATAALGWSAVSDPSGVTYALQIATDATFGTIVLEKKGLATPGSTLSDTEKLPSVSKEKPYYWRVKAIDGASNESPWSAAKSFSVGFVLAKWATYVIFAAIALIVGIFGFWLGRKTYPY